MKIRRIGKEPAFSVGEHLESLLLATLLDDEDDVRRAYRYWEQSVDWDGHFGVETFQLLPLLYLNLDRVGVGDPTGGRLRGLYRRSWYRNQRLRSILTEIVKKLRVEQLDIVLLGDLALVEGVYEKPGARIVDRIDLLVDPTSVNRCIAILKADGWQAQPLHQSDLTYLSYWDLTSDGGDELRVNWRPLYATCASEAFSLSAYPLYSESDQTRLALPSDTELLCHLAAPRLETDGNGVLADIAGVFSLVKRGEVDWDCVLQTSDDYGFDLRLYSLCTCIAAVVPTSIPATVLSELGDREASVSQRIAQRIAEKKPEAPDAFFGPLLRLMARYARYMRGSSIATAIAGIPAFLRHYYSMSSLLRIALRVLGNGARRSLRLARRAIGTRTTGMTEPGRFGGES